MSIDFLIYAGMALIFIAASGYLFIYLQERKVLNEEKNENNEFSCEEPKGKKINVCTDNEKLTDFDKELREDLFSEYVLKLNEDGLDGYMEGQIIVPFESTIFLTKEYSPIVNENGEIIISIQKKDGHLILDEPGEVEEKEEDVLLEDLEKSYIDEEEISLKTIKENNDEEVKDDNLNETIVKNYKNENTEEVKEDSIVVDDGFLTSSKPEEEVNEDILNKNFMDILNEEADDDFDQIADSIDEENDDIFGDIDEDYDEDVDNFVEKKDFDRKKVDSRSDAEELYATIFDQESLPVISQDAIIGSTVDLDDAIDFIKDNKDSIHDIIVKNIFALDGALTTKNDKRFLLEKRMVAKAVAVSLSQNSSIQKLVEKHLSSNKGTRDLEDCVSFISSNDKYIVDVGSKYIFSPYGVKKENDMCKIFAMQVSYDFIEDFFPDYSDVIIKFPPYNIEITEINSQIKPCK